MKENELTPFTFPDTGETVLIRKTSPLLIMQLRRDFPEPKPPTQEVEINGKKVVEENRAHPSWQGTLDKYHLDFEQTMRRVLIRQGVTVKMTPEVKKRIENLRTEYFEDTGIELQGSDSYVFVSYIGIGTDEDMEDLIEVITKRSQPTRKGIEVAQDSFPSKV